MFKQEIIKKYTAGITARISAYDATPAEDLELTISTGNDKIGKCMNVSLPAVMACANCSGCGRYCYEIKNLRHPSVLDARARNFSILSKDRAEYFGRIDRAISRRRVNKFFRWHVAGDIVDMDYFVNMVEIARRHPDFIFWTYTKNYDVVNEYVRQHGGSRSEAIPANFSIMFSEWRGMDLRNPYGFPVFSVVFKDDAVKPAGFYCPGNCDYCKANKRGCIVGENTYCNEH